MPTNPRPATDALPPLPTVVIGGWLGAGKTTLINHLLRHADGRRVAVLVNDFGSVNIDADLIESRDANVLGLAGGCLCCSFGDDLVGTLNTVARRDPRPDVVLVELSGVALPHAVVRTIGLAPAVQCVGTLVLADAATVRAQATDRYVGDTVRQQLADADWLLLNKADLVASGEAEACAAWLATRAPQARLWTGVATEVPPELVLGWRPQDEERPPRNVDQAFAARPIGAAARAAVDAASAFDSLSLELPAGTDLAALGARLAAPDSGVLRAKGLALDAQGQGQALQVAGGRWAVTPAAVQGPGRLVLIGLRGRWDVPALRGWVGAA